jgi:exosortase N
MGSLTLYLGLAILPFSFQMQKGVYAKRYLVPALLLTVFGLFVPARSVMYFSILFTVLLLFENFGGKVSINALFVLIIISPLFKFFSDTLGFPLRLWLSKLVAQTMAFAGMQCRSAGNIIYIDQYEFYIDQACAGLNMLHVSLLLSLFIVSMQQKKESKHLGFFPTFFFLVVVLALNICSNYSRILLIVIFKIMPETTLHEFAGILSMVAYVILPLFFLSKKTVQYFGKPNITTAILQCTTRFSFKNVALPTVLIITLVVLITKPRKTTFYKHSELTAFQHSGYQKSILENDVIKFENREAIIYYKPTPCYAPEHNPMICWTGSGYEFKFIEKSVIKGIEIYTGTLEKGKDKLYAAWWFDNGKFKTINPLSWRWAAAKGGSSFYLVNVNTALKSDLKKIVSEML